MERATNSLNAFVLEFRQALSNFDIDQFKNATAYLTEAKLLDATSNISPELYCRYLDKVVENAEATTTNIDELEDFFSKIYKAASLDTKGITIMLRPDNDISKIRPDYLDTFVSEVNTSTQKILAGTMSDNEVRRKYVSGSYFEKLKKQLVNTTVVVKDVRDLMILDNPTPCAINNIFVQNNIIPFLRSYEQNVKDMVIIARNTKAKIYAGYEEIHSVMNSVNAMRDEGKVDAAKYNTFQLFIFNILRQFMNACAYISGMIIRKLAYYSYNVMSYSNLYNTIHNYFPDGELILHESVINADMGDIDDTTLLTSVVSGDLKIVIPHIQNAINKKQMELASLLSREFNVKMTYFEDLYADKYPYDTYPYVAANQTVIDIVNDLSNFANLVKDNAEDIVVDDVLEKTHLGETFTTRFSNVLSALVNINYYTAQAALTKNADGEVSMALYHDLTKFEKNAEIISTNVGKCYKYLEELIEYFGENKVGMDDVTYNEIKSILEQTMKNFKDYALILTKKLLERLENLTETLNDNIEVVDPSVVEPFVPYDYAVDSIQEAYNDIENAEKAIFESMLKDYNTLKAKKDRGVDVVYEEVTPAGGDNAKSGDVKTDAAQQNAAKETTTSTTTTTTAPTGDKKSAIQKFKDWVANILRKFKEKSVKISTKNNKWLASVKESILGLNTENTSITLASYGETTSDGISKDINAAISKINSITPDNLPNDLKGSKAQAELYLFPTIPAKIDKQDTFAARIKHFMTHGNTPKQNLLTYSGNDAKTKIGEMIGYCEGYAGAYEKLIADINKLTDAAAKKQAEIIDSMAAKKNVNESAMFEAQANEVKVDGKSVGNTEAKETVNAGGVITSVCREYTGAVLTAFEKKYLDYIKVLSKLAPKKEGAAPETTAETPKEGEAPAEGEGNATA